MFVLVSVYRQGLSSHPLFAFVFVSVYSQGLSLQFLSAFCNDVFHFPVPYTSYRLYMVCVDINHHNQSFLQFYGEVGVDQPKGTEVVKDAIRKMKVSLFFSFCLPGVSCPAIVSFISVLACFFSLGCCVFFFPLLLFLLLVHKSLTSNKRERACVCVCVCVCV